ncbi:Hsp20 family protein [Populus alba x Populus x berolinensis]|nr:Hsp20 family protein [Populus alba x Populus x berolinensis]
MQESIGKRLQRLTFSKLTFRGSRKRSSGKFLRRFRLPENAKMDQVKASMENGVLTVTIPKAEEKKAEVKAIEISG